MDVFISHASAEIAVAKRMTRALEKDGLAVWLDDSDIRAGVLLRDQLAASIGDAKAFVILWSKAAARSRWVAAELLTAFHLDRPIIPCSHDDARLPQFMRNLLRIDVSGKTRGWPKLLVRAVREAPGHAFQPIVMKSQEPKLRQTATSLGLDQVLVPMALVARRPKEARKYHDKLDRSLAAARRRWPHDSDLLNIAAYHAKDAYMLKHWERIQAGQQPPDRLLQRAERMFFQTLFVDPCDADALNGLASILILEHELEAARFFNARAIEVSERAGLDYSAAKRDRDTIEYWLRRRAQTSPAS